MSPGKTNSNTRQPVDDYSDLLAIDKLLEEERERKEKMTTPDLKGKKTDAEPSMESDKLKKKSK